MIPKHPKHPPVPAHAAKARVAGGPLLLDADRVGAPAAARASKPAVAVRADLGSVGGRRSSLPAAPVNKAIAPPR
jgi:hypothetical protein